MRVKEELRKEREAARLKAASQRATARRIVKESVELIEDEKLELMDLAASSKGLPSIVHLDIDTLQNLESFRGIGLAWKDFCDFFSVFFTKCFRGSHLILVEDHS